MSLVQDILQTGFTQTVVRFLTEFEVHMETQFVNVTKLGARLGRPYAEWRKAEGSDRIVGFVETMTGQPERELVVTVSQIGCCRHGTWADFRIAIAYAGWLDPNYLIVLNMFIFNMNQQTQSSNYGMDWCEKRVTLLRSITTAYKEAMSIVDEFDHNMMKIQLRAIMANLNVGIADPVLEKKECVDDQAPQRKRALKCDYP